MTESLRTQEMLTKSNRLRVRVPSPISPAVLSDLKAAIFGACEFRRVGRRECWKPAGNPRRWDLNLSGTTLQDFLLCSIWFMLHTHQQGRVLPEGNVGNICFYFCVCFRCIMMNVITSLSLLCITLHMVVRCGIQIHACPPVLLSKSFFSEWSMNT